MRDSKFEPLVDRVELIEANPCYSRVRFPNGNEDTVSNKHLAPPGGGNDDSSLISNQPDQNNADTSIHELETTADETDTSSTPNSAYEQPSLRRSQRARRQPDRLTYYKL